MTWQEIDMRGKACPSVCHHSAAVVHHFIIIFGGIHPHGHALHEVQAFNTRMSIRPLSTPYTK